MKKSKEYKGTVISTSMKDTVVVEVERQSRHPLYKKIMKHTKHFVAHNTDASIAVGDYVSVAECKPISKTKHFMLVGKVQK